MSKDHNVIKYRKPININIGIIVFFIIFIYIVFNIFSYFTKTHISVYEVEQGTIVENNTYMGLALRTEHVVNADYAGYISYYMQENKKAAFNSLICSVDETGDVVKKIQQATSKDTTTADDSYRDIEKDVNDYTNSFSNMSFSNVYAFKENLDSQIMESINLKALNSIGDYTSYAQNDSKFHLMYSQEPGLACYYTDGYEAVTPDTFTSAMMNELNYKKNNLKEQSTIKATSPAYKLITSEQWNIVLSVSEKTYESLANNTSVQLEFKEDQKKVWAGLSEKQVDGGYYLILTLNNSMIRYANERFIEVELLLNEESGLKIPNSSISSKSFFTVPKEYFTQGDDSTDLGVLVKNPSTNSVNFLTTTIYYADDANYYIDEEDIKNGCVIQKPNSSDTFTIAKTASLSGVYNINKGYAVFKQIDVLYQNEEYAIIKTGTDYGISLYDHIALDGSKVTENSFIN